MRLVLGSLLLNIVTDYGESRFNTVNDSGEFLVSLLCVRYEEDSMRLVLGNLLLNQWWANLDQASKDLDKTIFRDVSPTPIP
jgi:hypothetical protein